MSVKRSLTLTAHDWLQSCFITTQHAMARGNGNGKIPTNNMVWDTREDPIVWEFHDISIPSEVLLNNDKNENI